VVLYIYKYFVIRLLHHPLPLSSQKVVSLALTLGRLSSLLTGNEWGEGGGGRSQIIYDGEDDWSFINHSILKTTGYNILYRSNRFVLEQVIFGWLVTVNYMQCILYTLKLTELHYTTTPKLSCFNSEGPSTIIW
jgi:hypothetical protein